MFVLLLIFVNFLLVFPRQANAYLDPGTGSYITQLIIGLLLAGSYLIKVYWLKIKSGFKSIFKSTTKNAKNGDQNK